MNKIKTLFAILIITLSTFLQSGIAIANANTKAEEILSSKPVLGNSDTVDVKPGDTKAVFENLNIKPNVSISEGVYSVIDLPKAYYDKPTTNDLTTDAQVAKSEIGETDTTYQIKYWYQGLKSGTELSIPFKVHVRKDVKPQIILKSIIDKTYDKDGTILSNGGSLDLQYKPIMPTPSIQNFEEDISKDNVDSDQKLNKDYTIKNAWYGSPNNRKSLVWFGFSTSSNWKTIIDVRDYEVKVKLEAGFKFDESANDGSWTFDDTTHTATYLNKPDANGVHSFDSINIPLIAEKGVTTDVEHAIDISYNPVGQPDEIFNTGSGSILLHPDEQLIHGLGKNFFTVKAERDNRYWSNNWFLPATKVQFLDKIYPANPDGQKVDPIKVIKTKVTSIVDEPQPDVKASADYEGTSNNDETLKGYGQVYDRAAFINDEIPTGDYQQMIVDMGLNENTFTVTYEDDTTEVKQNVDLRYNVKFNKDLKGVKKIELKFTNPAVFNSDDKSAFFYLQLTGDATSNSVSITDKMRNEQIQPEELLDYGFENKATISYDDGDPDRMTYEEMTSVDINKVLPHINAKDLTYSEGQLLSGGTINATTNFDVYNAQMLKDPNLKNAKVAFLFNPGVKLDDSKMDQVKNLKNLQVINNYKNSGKTAIIGDITNDQISSSKKNTNPVDQDDGNFLTTTLSYTIPITATKALDRGKVNGEAFLILDNDKSTYDYTKVDQQGYKVANKNSANNYGLYNDTDYVDGYVHTAGTFDYEPAARLTVIKMVSKENEENWVEDTGKVASASGEAYKYRLKIANYSLHSDFNQLDSVDVLPTKGDQMITEDKDRGSQFPMQLSGPVTDIPANVKVYYSTDAPKDSIDSDLDSNWVDASQVSDWSKVTMIRIKGDDSFILQQGKSITMTAHVVTPEGVDYSKDMISGNTFAAKATDENGSIQAPVESDTAIIGTTGDDPVIPDKQGNIKVIKQDELDSSKLLANAEFKLTSADNNEYTGTTDSNGEINFSNLPTGEYKLVETKAPAGYKLDTTEYTITVEDGQTTTQIVKDQQEVTQEFGSLEIKKVDDTDATMFLPDAGFKLTSSDNQEYTGVTDATGTLKFDSLPVGEYTLEETSAPAGYELNTEKYTVTVSKDTVTTQIVTDKKVVVPEQKGTFKIEKIDADNHNLKLADAEFTLKDQDGKTVQSGKTDSNGQLLFENVDFGTYQLVETKAPTGYEITKDQTITIGSDDESPKLITVEDHKKDIPVPTGSVKIIKVDSQTHQTLANAEFELTDVNGKTYQLITNNSGEVIANNLPVGEVTIKETKAPTGYKISTQTYKTSVIADKTTEITIQDLKDENSGGNNDNEENNNSNSSHDKGQSAVPGTVTKKTTKHLPQTGESLIEEILVSMLGWMTITTAIYFSFYKRISKDN